MPLIGATYRQNLLDTLISRGLIERSPHYVLSMSDYIYNMFDIMPHELPSKVGFPYVTIMVYNPTLTGGKVPTFSEAAPFLQIIQIYLCMPFKRENTLIKLTCLTWLTFLLIEKES